MTTPTFDPQPCCGDAAGAACMQPMQFCQTSTTTGPVEHPGRVYDLTLPINPGFTVDQLIQDEVTQNAGITWSIFDPDGSAFANELRDFIQSRMAGTTVTVTNPNAGTPQVCGNALPMQVHIECLRIDQDPPNLVELVFNAGADLIQNPAYNENPPLNPPVAQGNYGFHLLSRQDDPGPFPGNQPSNDALCTSVANRGWETNDVGRTFEIWGQDVASAQNTTPTPRGTPVQEMTSDGPPPGGISTVWQTFNVLAPGTFNIRVVHGARDPGETHRITLSTGDTDDNQVGDVINDVTTPPSVTSSGGPNPWTTFNQSIPLNAGTYTLALSSTDPSPDARGGLFTDMRVFLDRPNTRATAVNDDETCTVTAEETTTSSVCTFWTPGCEGGQIATWTNTETGATLTNTEFWAQTPKPSCCDGAAAAPGGNGVQSNLVVSDIVCAVIGGIQQNVVREVLFDASGGELEVAFIGANGARLNPDSWTPGDCVSQRDMHDVILCDQQADGTTVSFLRKYVQTWSPTLGAQVNEIRDFTIGAPTSTYTVTGTVVNCAQTVNTAQAVVLCDAGASNQQFLRHYQHTGDEMTGFEDSTLDGSTPYVPVGPVVACSNDGDFTTTGLCLGDGTPIGVVNRRTVTGTVVQDGWINLLTGTFSVGLPPAGTTSCATPVSIQNSDVLCDITTGTGTVNGLVIIQYNYNPDGSIASTVLLNATTGTPYGAPVGEITVCPTDIGQPDRDMQVLCDVQANGTQVPIVRDYVRDPNGIIISFNDYTVNGVSYTATGTVGSCIPRDVETVILCDSAATPNRFLRTYTYGSTGAISGFTDTTLAGAPFTPTGAVNNCVVTTATDQDFLEEVLCDGNGTPFIRRFTFNSQTGAVISTTNLTLAGTAFTPVGTVGTCTGCCPVVMGEGCTNTGSGRYTALRLANGTISLIDSVTGTAVTQAQIIACAGDGGTSGVTLTAEARTVTNGTPWTPGADVTGTLTSVTVTGTVGLWDMVDANGTALTGLPPGLTLTWSALDGNTLTGPQSITPQTGSTVVVNWTRK